MKLLVVIVNYKTADLVVDCLKSLVSEVPTVPGTRVVVTDNASDDGSVQKIQEAIAQNGWHWASVMPLPRNGGFAWGNNQAIEPALKSDDPPQYAYLLNPDTIVLPDALRELVKFMDDRPQVGIAGGRVINPDGERAQNSVFRFHTVLGELESTLRLSAATKLLRKHVVASPPPDEPAPTDWASGASMIVRREVFQKVGLMDDAYFMYYEETDFCLRARRAGWECWYVPSSRIIHLVGQSSGVTGTRRAARRRPRYWFESRHRFFMQHYGALRTLGADLLWTFGYAVGTSLQKLRGKPRTDPPWLWWDFVRYSFMSWGHRL